MDQSHRHDALGQTTSPVISSMRAASAVISVFPSVPRNVLITSKNSGRYRPEPLPALRPLHGNLPQKQVIKKEVFP